MKAYSLISYQGEIRLHLSNSNKSVKI